MKQNVFKRNFKTSKHKKNCHLHKNTFSYKNTGFIVAKFNKRCMESVRDTVVTICCVTSNPLCRSFPIFLAHWATVDRTDFKGIVVFSL